MKKLGKKLRLDRETVRRLDSREVPATHLVNVQGGAILADNAGIDWTGCDSACTEC